MTNRMGWICPRCDSVKSPDVTECRCNADLLRGLTPSLPPEPPSRTWAGGVTAMAAACGDYNIINGHGETLP